MTFVRAGLNENKNKFLPQDTPIVLFVNQKGLAYFHAFVQYEGHFEVQVG